MNTDSISVADAAQIDREWRENGMKADQPRAIGYRVAGNRTRTFLTIPGDDNAPCYELLTHGHDAPAYYHVSGPTLDEWQEQREATEASREARELYEWASGR